jgi:hypothetical protein
MTYLQFIKRDYLGSIAFFIIWFGMSTFFGTLDLATGFVAGGLGVILLVIAIVVTYNNYKFKKANNLLNK